MSSTLEIPLFKPAISNNELAAANESLRSGWLGLGSYEDECERRLQVMIGSQKEVVCVSTGHAAIHLALLQLGVGPGDEVVTPALNHVADFQAISATGASIVFCDVRESDMTISPESLERVISDRTKAIIAIDYAGCHFDSDGVQRVSSKYGVAVLHDASHSFGSQINGKYVGSHTFSTIFSFDAVKTCTAIDGGAVVVDTDEAKQWLRRARMLGTDQSSVLMYEHRRPGDYDVNQIGFRYHLANLHAAIGLSQISRLNEFKNSRLTSVNSIRQGLKSVSDLRITGYAENYCPFLLIARVPKECRDDLRKFLLHNGIETGLHWANGANFTQYSAARKAELPVTENVTREIITLPLHSGMEKESEERIVRSINLFFGK